jgi:2-haloalkanoic acid dehalogenase type II
MSRHYQAVLFDLLTALLDSWTVWDKAAGTPERGRAWRAEYLKLTYGCGAYRPYEALVAEAAAATGVDAGGPIRLETAWQTLSPWSGVTETLRGLEATHRMGVVTNCSERLGRIAAECVGVHFDVIVTSERAGYYKPDPHPYQLALGDLGLPASAVLFVAGSGYDLFGTAACGLDTYWHNRIGLAAPAGAPAPLLQSPDLAALPALALRA